MRSESLVPRRQAGLLLPCRKREGGTLLGARPQGPGRILGAYPSGGERQAGFTLIEILVALAVFSLAALALIRLESAGVREVAVLDRTMLAGMVARNVALDALTGARAPALGQSAGTEVNGGRAWRWTRVVAPTGDPRIVRIEVAVMGAGGQVLGRATMVRPPDGEGR